MADPVTPPRPYDPRTHGSLPAPHDPLGHAHARLRMSLQLLHLRTSRGSDPFAMVHGPTEGSYMVQVLTNAPFYGAVTVSTTLLEGDDIRAQQMHPVTVTMEGRWLPPGVEAPPPDPF